MRLFEFIKIAWEALLKNKVRSLLTMLGIIIGVTAVIVMISISAGTEATIKDQITSLGSNLLYVRQNFAQGGFRSIQSQKGGLVYDDAWAIDDQVSGVKGVVVEQDATENITSETSSLESVTILGTSPDFLSVRDMELKSGRFFNTKELDRKTKVVVLGFDVAAELFGQDNPVGQQITVGNTRMNVIGVLAEKGTVGNVDYDAQVFTPISVVFQKFSPTEFAKIIGDRVRTIVVEVDDTSSLDTVEKQITLLLAKRHDVSVDEADFAISSQEDIIATRESTTSAFRSLLSWVAGVSLIVGGIGIMNIMMVSVTERTREIGIRQSIGATPNDIRFQFLSEALLLSLIGGVIGIFTGIGTSWIYGLASSMRTVIQPGSIILAFSSAAIIGVFFGYYPANQAAQLDPIDALRYE